MSGIGHNGQLKAFIERIEKMNEEADAIKSDIKDIYAEAKSTGFDVKAMRKIVALRKEDAHKRQEREAILETYMHALGMISDLPLGRAALVREGLIDGA
jgi:uncharacterized protein (UPF0335 family)